MILPEVLQQRLDALGLFNAEWYCRQYPDVAASGLSPWQHFIRYGGMMGRLPGPGFDPEAYMAAHPEAADAILPPLLHYLKYGPVGYSQTEDCWLKSAEAKLNKNRERVAASELFNAEWYLERYPDVATHKRFSQDPVMHYLLYGAIEGRDPGPEFDTSYYLSQMPLQETPLPSGKVPLLHYLLIGKSQGLQCLPQPQEVPAWYNKGVPPDDGTLRILYVLSVHIGGTPQTNEDLMQALHGEAECLVLYCRGPVMLLTLYREGRYLPLAHHTLSEVPRPLPHRSTEYDRVVAEWLVHYRIRVVHVRHIAWQGLGLIEVAKRKGIPVAFSFHDYYTLCPSVKLLDERQRFCGGRCTATLGECDQGLWPASQMPPLKHRAIHEWQQAFAQILPLADAMITTSPSAREVITAIYPELDDARFKVIPHGRDFPRMIEVTEPPELGTPLRVVLPGFISLAKGGELLQGLAAQAKRLNLELHVVGVVDSAFDLSGNVVVHGRYHRDRLPELLATIRPHIGAVLSIWPETHCHTLTELWACGVPVVGIDMGAVGERLAATGGGWRVPDPTLEAVSQTLKCAADPSSWQTARAAVRRWQQGAGRKESCAWMAERYLTVYRTLI